MIWLNLKTTTLRSAEYVGCDPVQRATWLNLLAYCCEQENGGKIEGCGGWKDRQWQQTLGVTLAEVREECALWRWEGEALCVAFYPDFKEEEVKARREAGKRGGSAKTEAKKQASRHNGAKHNPSKTQAQPKQNPSNNPTEREWEREGNDKGKERETITNVIVAETPTRGEVLEAAKLMGVDAQVAEIFFDEAESRPITPDGEWTDRNGQPMRNWRNALKAYGNKWLANARGTAFAQNGAAKALTRPEGVWSLEKRIEAAKAEIERIRGDEKNWMRRADKPWERELKPEAKDLMRGFKQQITDLQRQITGVAA
jgi:hypothetical protein